METAEDNRESITAELELLISSNKPTVARESSIFRIPNVLSEHNRKAYLPNAFSFGPWHHDECNLQSTQALKINYLKGLLNRFPDPSAKLLELVSDVCNIKDQARQSYAGEISFSDDELVKILVLDGCFITEFFRKYSNATRDENDPIFTVPCMLQSLYHDLFLLENQIPWLVLRHMFGLTNESTEESNPELHQLAISFFSKIFYNDGLPGANEFRPSATILHVIDLLRQYLLANSSQSGWTESSSREQKEEPIPSASELSRVGVKFKRGESMFILDIKFHHGVVELPLLSFHYATETLFRNLIAFEQSCYGLPTIFTSYAKFMNKLIGSVADFHTLCRSGIISNSLLSPEDAAGFFNKICDDVRVTHFHYDIGIYKKLNRYYRKKLIILCASNCCCFFCTTLYRCCCRLIGCAYQ